MNNDNQVEKKYEDEFWEWLRQFNYNKTDNLLISEVWIVAKKQSHAEHLKELEVKNKEIEELRSNLEWAVDLANYWADNKTDRQKCADLEYKYKLKIDRSHEEQEGSNEWMV